MWIFDVNTPNPTPSPDKLAETLITSVEAPEFSHTVTFHDGSDQHPHRALIYFKGQLLVDQPADDWTMNLFPQMVKTLNDFSALTQLRAENEKLLAERENWRMSSVCRDLKAELERANGLLLQSYAALSDGKHSTDLIAYIAVHLNPRKTP